MRERGALFRSAIKRTLERVLQAQLDLPHPDLSAADHAEILVRVRAGLPGERRARQNVQVRHSPVRMVERVKSLHPELQDMVFVEGHPELLVHFGVDIDNARTLDGIPADVAEEPGAASVNAAGFNQREGVGLLRYGLTPVDDTGRS